MKKSVIKLPEVAKYPYIHNWFENKKLYVKMNIGNWSEKCFGKVGDEVKYNEDGKIYSKTIGKYDWTIWKLREGKTDIEKLNDCFSLQDKFQTIFEVR